jgi:DNA-binding XRE family transcriptional regulator
MQAQTTQSRYFGFMPSGRIANKPAPKFGQRMTAFRVAKGLTQSDLAAALGMTRNQIAYYERASTNPSMETVEKIAAFFGVTVGELLNDTTKTKNKPGPPSQLARLTERLSKLPRGKQKVVTDMLEGLLKQAAG